MPGMQQSERARSQKSAMGGCFGGVGAESPAAGSWGSEAKPPAFRKFCIFLVLYFFALKSFIFFLQKELNFRPILIEINATETWHRK